MSSRKRKASEDLSQNRNTLKERRRQEKRSQDQIEYEKRKIADNTAWSREKNRVSGTAQYQNASGDQRNQISNTAQSELIQKRYCRM
jgi:hypothetical protein